MNRNVRTPQAGASAEGAQTPAHQTGSTKKDKFKKGGKWSQVLYGVFSFSIFVLVIALLVSIVFNSNAKESKAIDTTKTQAVFLNGGQVYFGNITELNDKYLKLNSVYYLRVNSQSGTTTQTTTNSNDVSLVKLGCELHGPQDQMVITKDQVIFWENLKSDGQVVKAITEYIKTNPNGQKCDQQTSNSNSNNLQNSSGAAPTGTTNGTTNTNTTNPQKP